MGRFRETSRLPQYLSIMSANGIEHDYCVCDLLDHGNVDWCSRGSTIDLVRHGWWVASVTGTANGYAVYSSCSKQDNAMTEEPKRVEGNADRERAVSCSRVL